MERARSLARTRASVRLAALLYGALLFGAAAGPSARAQTVLFAEDFEHGTAHWTTEGYWHHATAGPPCLDSPFPSGTHGMWYGIELSCDFDGPDTDRRSLRLATPFTVPTGAGHVYLDFRSRFETETEVGWDLKLVEATADGGQSWENLLWIQGGSQPWTLHTVDLSGYSGQSIELRFAFWAGDSWDNTFLGWLIDDVVIRTERDVYPPSCFGSQGAPACPCGNQSPLRDRAGCLNSTGSGGALRASGFASLAHDTLTLAGSGMTDTPVLYYQGASVANGGAGVLYGDGLNCTGGPLRRLGMTQNEKGSSTFPASGISISERGHVLAPGTRWYQAVYRDSPSFCAPAAFNATNQVRVDWTP